MPVASTVDHQLNEQVGNAARFKYDNVSGSVEILGLIRPPSGLSPFILQVRESGYETKGRDLGDSGV